MARQIEGIEFSRAADSARRLADAAIVAYWMQSEKPGAEDFHRRNMRDELDRLCAVLGLRLVDADDAPAQPLLTEAAA